MKQTESCPKCKSLKLFVVDEVRRRLDGEGVIGTAPVAVTGAMVAVRTAGIFGESEQQRSVDAGRLEAWICAACGYTEWYASRLHELATLAGASSAVRVIEREAEGEAYRS